MLGIDTLIANILVHNKTVYVIGGVALGVQRARACHLRSPRLQLTPRQNNYWPTEENTFDEKLHELQRAVLQRRTRYIGILTA